MCNVVGWLGIYLLVPSNTGNLTFVVGLGCEDNWLSAYVQATASIKGLW